MAIIAQGIVHIDSGDLHLSAPISVGEAIICRDL